MVQLPSFRTRPVALLAGAFAALLLTFVTAVAGARAASPPSSGTATVALSTKASATSSLRKGKITVKAVKPASVTTSRWNLPVHGTPALDATSVALDGELRFVAGKRSVSFIGLRLSFGSKPTITGALATKKMAVLSLGGAPTRDAAARTIRFEGTSVSLTPKAAAAMKKQLKLKKLSAGTLGTLTLTVRASAPVSPPAPTPTPTPTTPVVTPAPVTPTPTTPTAPTTPTTPVDPCRVDQTPLPSTPPPAATVRGQTRWSALTLPGGSEIGYGNLRSWINYVTICWSPAGTVEAVDGAARVGADKYTYDLSIVGDTTSATGRTLTHAGTIAYRLPAHGIDTRITDPVLHLDATGTAGTVTASGRYSADRANPDAAPVPFTNWTILNLTLVSGAAASPATYAATLTADGKRILGDTDAYPVDAPWGTFTVPAP